MQNYYVSFKPGEHIPSHMWRSGIRDNVAYLVLGTLENQLIIAGPGNELFTVLPSHLIFRGFYEDQIVMADD